MSQDEEARRARIERLRYCQLVGEALVALDDRLKQTMLDIDNQQDAARVLLADICNFLAGAGASREAVALLQGLTFQLEDLRSGNVGPLVSPVIVPHRPVWPIGEQMVAAYAALAMECEMHFGVKKSPAAQTVAKLLHRQGIRTGRDGRPLTAVTIAKWRERLSQGPKDNLDWSHAHAAYRRAQEKMDERLAHPDGARRLIEELPNLLARFGNPTKPPT